MTQDIVPFGDLVKGLAQRFEITPEELWQTVKAQCFEGGVATNGQMMMLLSFAKQYDLNPLAKECYAFISKGGKRAGTMTVGVQVDGWTKIANRHRNEFTGELDYDGQDVTYEYDQKTNKLIAIEATTYVKGRAHPTVYRAVLDEWYQLASDVWKAMPTHQLFIKARDESIRFAFGISAYDPDDISRMEAAQAVEVRSTAIADTSDSAVVKTPELMAGAGTTIVAEPEHQEVGLNGNAEGQRQSTPDASDGRSPQAPRPEENALGSEDDATTEGPIERVRTKRGRPPKDKRAQLDHLIEQKVTAARLNLILAQHGVEKIEELNDEQVSGLISRLEKR